MQSSPLRRDRPTHEIIVTGAKREIFSDAGVHLWYLLMALNSGRSSLHNAGAI
jgi:hypothetical protein